MTTRSGTRYKQPEMDPPEGVATIGMVEVLRMIHDAKERRERAAAPSERGNARPKSGGREPQPRRGHDARRSMPRD